MNLLTYAAFLCLTAREPAMMHAPRDTAGIYNSREDFLTGQPNLLSPGKIKVRHYPFWRSLPLNIGLDENVYMQRPDGTRKTLAPGSVFGFVSGGVKYMYVPGEKRYLAVLSDKGPVYFFLKEKYISSFKMDFVDDSLLYTRSLDEPLRAFTPDNIGRDFADNPALLKKFNALRQIIRKKGYDGEVHRRCFLKFRRDVQQCLDSDVPPAPTANARKTGSS